MMADYGFATVGVDPVARPTNSYRGDMRELPFDDDTFDIALSYGTFYYGTWGDMLQAVDEMHRVLRPGGHGFVCVRTTDDWRAQCGRRVDFLTYKLNIPGESEDGMVMNFLTESHIEAVYAAFSDVSWEKAELTSGRSERFAKARRNSDWLISVTK